MKHVCVECGSACVNVTAGVGRGVSPLCANWTSSIAHVFLFDLIPTFSGR